MKEEETVAALAELNLCDGSNDSKDLEQSPVVTAELEEVDSKEDGGVLLTSDHSDNGKSNISFCSETNQNALQCKGGFFFAVHFEKCGLVDNIVFDNCTFVNVRFEDCIFNDAIWSHVFLQNVKVSNCSFNSYTWHNGHHVDVTFEGEDREDKVDFGDGTPQEITDPKWLEEEKRNVVDSFRRGKAVSFRMPRHVNDYAYAKLTEDENITTDIEMSEDEESAMNRAIKNASRVAGNGSNVAAVIKGWHALAAGK